jgi:hypothetical protein
VILKAITINTKPAIILGAILLWGCIATAKPADVTSFPYMKHLVPEGGGEHALGRAILDSDLFADTHDDFSNMRIVDDSETEVPFLVRPRTASVTSTRDKLIPTRVESLRELPDNRIEIEIILQRKPEVSQSLRLTSRLRNFEKLVTVHGSIDGSTWKELASNVPIVDYSRFIDFENTEISFSPAPYKRLRLSISDVTLDRELPLKQTVREALHGKTQREFVETSFRREDFRIDEIRLMGKTTTETGQHAIVTKHPVSDFVVSQDGSLTIVEFAARREPVVGVQLNTATRNFSRPVLLEGIGAEQGSYSCITRGSLSHIAVGNVARDSRTLRLLQPTRCSKWRMTIDNKDNPVLDITGITLKEQSYEAVFMNSPTASYRSFYGGAETKKPRYDVATILTVAGRSPATEYKPGERQENREFERTRLRLHIGGNAVLTIAILIMVLALGWGVAVAAKKVDMNAM